MPDIPKQAQIDGNLLVEWDVGVPMDDGNVLSANVFRPPTREPVPVLMTYGPYAKDLDMRTGYPHVWKMLEQDTPWVIHGSSNRYQAFETPDPEIWVPRGYAVVRVDSRGAGRSPGVFDPLSAREARDLYESIEWAAAQPWSTGKVGLSGTSYFAMMMWRVAPLQPPHLAGMIVSEAVSDFYRERLRHGGILHQQQMNWYAHQIVPIQFGLGSRGKTNPYSGIAVSGDVDLPDDELAQNTPTNPYVEGKQRVLIDDWYIERSGDPARTVTPLLSIAHWGGVGLHLRGNVEGFAEAAATQKWLIVQGGIRGVTFFHGDPTGVQERFWAYFLKGEGDWLDEPKVSLYVRHPDRFEIRAEDDWPVPRTDWAKLYLDPAAQALSWEPPPAGSTATYAGFSQGVTMFSPAFEVETEITGPVALKLWLTSSTRDADVFATLRLFDAAGDEVLFLGTVEPRAPVGQGWLRASHRKLDPTRTLPWRPFHSHDERQPLDPGTSYELDVEIWPTSIVVPPGYRLALTVGGEDFDHGQEPTWESGHEVMMRGCGIFVHADPDDRPAAVFDGQVTISSGPDGNAHLLLPLIPGGRQ